MSELLSLNKTHIDLASETLAQAFQDYPLFQYAFPQKPVRMKILPHYYRILLHYAIRWGKVYAISGEMEGVAAWIRSDHAPAFRRMIRAVPASAIGAFFKTVMSNPGPALGGNIRLARPGKEISKIHRRHAPFRHWFLVVIGVKPEFQGKGYAGKMLLPVLHQIEKEGLPCFTDTQDQNKVGLYEHFGFKVMEEMTIPKTGVTTWGLLRDTPRPE